MCEAERKQKWQIVESMPIENLQDMMIKEADAKLRTLLSDVDPFWIRWSFWLSELDKKAGTPGNLSSN